METKTIEDYRTHFDAVMEMNRETASRMSSDVDVVWKPYIEIAIVKFQENRVVDQSETVKQTMVRLRLTRQ